MEGKLQSQQDVLPDVRSSDDGVESPGDFFWRQSSVGSRSLAREWKELRRTTKIQSMVFNADHH